MLERVGLGHRAEHRPNEMSGGEQQRVTVARALVGRPAIVWADEPTGNLDSTMARSVMELLQELNREEEQTIVLVTHDSAIGASAGRIVRMRDGRLESDDRRVTPEPALVRRVAMFPELTPPLLVLLAARAGRAPSSSSRRARCSDVSPSVRSHADAPRRYSSSAARCSAPRSS